MLFGRLILKAQSLEMWYTTEILKTFISILAINTHECQVVEM